MLLCLVDNASVLKDLISKTYVLSFVLSSYKNVWLCGRIDVKIIPFRGHAISIILELRRQYLNGGFPETEEWKEIIAIGNERASDNVWHAESMRSEVELTTTQSSVFDMEDIPMDPTMPIALPTPNDLEIPIDPSLPVIPPDQDLPTYPAIPIDPSLPVLPSDHDLPTNPSIPIDPSLPVLPSDYDLPTHSSIPIDPSLPVMPSEHDLPANPTIPIPPSMSSDNELRAESSIPLDLEMIPEWPPLDPSSEVEMPSPDAIPPSEVEMPSPDAIPPSEVEMPIDEEEVPLMPMNSNNTECPVCYALQQTRGKIHK